MQKNSLLALTFWLFTSCSVDKEPPLTPAEALATFQLPEGFHIELVAAEPRVMDPVAMAFDAQGRLFVVEMPDYPLGDEPRGRVKLLEDADGDGNWEKVSIFVESLSFPTSVLPWKDGILVTSAPHIYYFADRDQDNVADEKRIILTGFNVYNPQLRANGLLYGLDNWIYGAYPKVGPSRRDPERFGITGEPLRFPGHPEVKPVDISALGTDFRFRPDQLKLEPAAGNSQFGHSFDDRGNRFTLWNNKHIRQVMLDFNYSKRNPFQSISSAMNPASDHAEQSEVFSRTENPIYVHESEVGHFTSGCGSSIYAGGNLPPEYRGSYFICEPVHNLVHLDLLTPEGATYIARRAFETTEFLTSTDPWFRPVFITVGPDGALYLLDYYRKYIEHAEFMDNADFFPEGQEFNLRAGADRGRIYRIWHEGSRPTPGPRMRGSRALELVSQLSHPNLWWRLTAQRLLVERQDLSVTARLQELVGKAPSPEGRIHALWTLEGLGQLRPSQVLQGLKDPSSMVREQAVRLAEKVMSPSIQDRLVEMTRDPDDRVIYQLAFMLGAVPEEASFPALKEIISGYMEDPWYQIAVLTSAAGTATRWFDSLTREKGFLAVESPGKREFLNRIATIIGARKEPAEITRALDSVSRDLKAEASWWQTACLNGLAQGLEQAGNAVSLLDAKGQVSLFRLMQASSPDTGAAALRIAERVRLRNSARLRDLLNRAVSTVHNEGAGLKVRVNAARVLGLDPTPSSISHLQELLRPQEPLQIQKAAARGLIKQGGSAVFQFLLKEWKRLPVEVRDVVWTGLMNNRSYLKQVLGALESRELQPGDLGRTRLSQLVELGDPKTRERVAAVMDQLVTNRQPVVEKYLPAAGMQGDVSRGKQVFEENCSSCHELDGMGTEVGPALLTLVRRRSREFILREILDPNADIAPGYETYVIETMTGKVLTGVMTEDSPTTVTLKRENGEGDSIHRSSIKSQRVSSVSTMPEDLEAGISVEEMADLLTYFHRLRTPGPR